VWEAPTLGYYAFRSGWDKDAFVAQVFLKSQVIAGWNGANAGPYRLYGLGQNWATGTSDCVRNRQNENVVWLPEAGLEDGARGHLLFYEAKDKTCVISVDLNEVNERDNCYWLTEYGNLRYPAQPKPGESLPEPSGITGLRSLAFDYSGLSGAECLFVVVDRIDGGNDQKRFWLFQPPLSATTGRKGGPSPIAEVVKSVDRGFLVAPPGITSTLQGVFAHPSPVSVGTEPLTREYIKNWGTGRGEKIKVTINALTVPGPDHFFFVGTVTAGQQPTPQVKGSGLNAVVTIGKRTVRFDGQKVILGTQN